jgi:hypothetical protein
MSAVGADGGMFKFIGGLVLGFVLRSVGGLFLEVSPVDTQRQQLQ